jgi:transcriptional regulator with XRE-family HTH domain
MMDEKAYNKAVAINMRRIMYEKGISQVDLAKALGYSKQSVSQWMNGAHLPRMEKIDEICKFLGCKRSDLLEVGEVRPTVTVTPEQAEMIQLTLQANTDNVRLALDVLKRLEQK